MIYNITTRESSSSSNNIISKNIRLPLKSTNYNNTPAVLEGFTGASLDLDEKIKFRTTASHGSQPSINSGIFLINQLLLIK